MNIKSSRWNYHRISELLFSQELHFSVVIAQLKPVVLQCFTQPRKSSMNLMLLAFTKNTLQHSYKILMYFNKHLLYLAFA